MIPRSAFFPPSFSEKAAGERLASLPVYYLPNPLSTHGKRIRCEIRIGHDGIKNDEAAIIGYHYKAKIFQFLYNIRIILIILVTSIKVTADLTLTEAIPVTFLG